MTDYFTYKGYGRIYVQTEQDIDRVEQILMNNDEYEFEYYYPKGLVTTIDKYPNVIYNGKFEIHFDLIAECKKQNIPIFIFDAGFDDCTIEYRPPTLTKEEILSLMTKDT